MDFKSFTKHLIDVSTPQMLKDWIKALGNKIEEQEQSIQNRDKRIEALEEEIRKLKGLPAKPLFSDKTSELEDKAENKDKKVNPGKGKTRRKKHELSIDLTKQCKIDPSDLDATFEYKGKRRVIVQDILFQRNNICFELEKYYSSEHRKTVSPIFPLDMKVDTSVPT